MATIKDVAKLAGVSVATVSRVLNDIDNVKPKTAKVVKKAIEELNYHPNLLGRTLRCMKTMKILVLLPTISNQFFSRVLKGIQKTAELNGYSVMFAVTNDKRDVELQYINMLKQKSYDGIIFLRSNLSAEELSELSKSWPVVLASETVKNADIPTVTIDNRRAAFDATTFLILHGHNTIGLACAGTDYYSSLLRRNGYIDALNQYGLTVNPDYISDEGFSFNAGKRSAEYFLSLETLPDAIFAVADSVAIGMTSEFNKHGIKVGEDISIIGFDNNQITEHYIPKITTVSQPQFELGQKAFELLMDKIDDISCDNRHFILPHRIEVRDSVKLAD